MVLIIGSGAGGGILARELAIANVPVTIIEKGPYINSKEAFNHYDKSSEGMDLLKTTCIGGSTIVSMSNMVRVLENELKEDYNIDLSSEFNYIEDLLDVHPLKESHIGKGTDLFIKSAEKLDLNPIVMPKALNEKECVKCGNCAFGCPVDAKWSSKDFIDEAIENGAKLITEAEVNELIIEDNEIKGVSYIKNGQKETIYADTVVLCAGAVGSSVILQKAGINAGNNLFFDPFVTVGGVIKDINFNSEVQMGALVEGPNFILSPHFSSFIRSEIPEEDIGDKDILSIMVKTSDEAIGSVSEEGNISKYNSIQDIRYLAEGSAVAGFILKEAGVDPKTITSTIYRGAHPGGTAAIGKVVNNNLETNVKGLFVADASVLPTSPGKPPILTILALSKRLADYLKN